MFLNFVNGLGKHKIGSNVHFISTNSTNIYTYIYIHGLPKKTHCEEHLELPSPVCIKSTKYSQEQTMTDKFNDYGSMQKRNKITLCERTQNTLT
jgi:hypothetical protein